LKQKITSIYYLILSTISLFLLIILVLFNSSNIKPTQNIDRYILTFIFILCCIYGISRTKYPSWYKKLRGKNNLKTRILVDQKVKRKKTGHHPDCIKFKNHKIILKNKVFCTGCLGLLIGCIISIFLIFIYLIYHKILSLSLYHSIFFLGLIIIYITFFETLFIKKNEYFHIFTNIFFVISFLLIFISVFEITGRIIYGMICIVISFLLLETRINISNINHSSICFKCNDSCKMYD